MSPHHFGQMSQRSYPGVQNMKSEQFFSQEVPTEAWHHTKALMRLNLSGVEETLSPICLCFKARTQPRFPTHTKKEFFMLIYMNLISLKNANSQVYSNFFNASKVLAVRSVWGKASL